MKKMIPCFMLFMLCTASCYAIRVQTFLAERLHDRYFKVYVVVLDMKGSTETLIGSGWMQVGGNTDKAAHVVTERNSPHKLKKLIKRYPEIPRLAKEQIFARFHIKSVN